MAFLDQLQNLQEQLNRQRQAYLSQAGVTPQRPYASFYPEYEISTPQFQTPNARTLTQLGYRSNELVYTCIQTRSQAIAEAEINVILLDEEERQVISQHPLKKLMKRPTPGLSEQEFWQIVETYVGIAGFSAWEKERNKKGEVIRLWPMRPDWCSFIRGQQKPVAYVRYQPDGMEFVDLPIEDVVLFQYFDPMYPMLKGLSPTMVALDLVDTDNTSTKTVKRFLENGNFLGGVLKTEQVLTDAEADRIRQRWNQTHSGSENSGSIAVFGRGVEFTQTGQTFKDATFPELDARSEARICMVFRVPPMLIGAKIGVDRSTYSNYQEARKGFYESAITSEWKFLAGQLEEQLLFDFEDNPDNFTIEFDTRGVVALQEDRTEQVNRAKTLWESGIGTLNEARAEAKLDPVEEEEGDKRKGDSSSQAPGDSVAPGEDPGADAGEDPKAKDAGDTEDQADGEDMATETQVKNPKSDGTGADSEMDQETNNGTEDSSKKFPNQEQSSNKKFLNQEMHVLDMEQAMEEVRSFRKFAKARIKEGKASMVPTYDFQVLTLGEQDLLIGEFKESIEARSIAQSLGELVRMMQA